MSEEMKKEGTCSICKGEFGHFGNNPAPFPWEKDERCCDDCNRRFVVPVRILNIGHDVDPEGALMVILTKIAELGSSMVKSHEKFLELQKEGKIPGPENP